MVTINQLVAWLFSDGVLGFIVAIVKVSLKILHTIGLFSQIFTFRVCVLGGVAITQFRDTDSVPEVADPVRDPGLRLSKGVFAPVTHTCMQMQVRSSVRDDVAITVTTNIEYTA